MQIYEKQFKPGLKQKYKNKRECLDPQQGGPRGRAQMTLHTSRKDGMSDEMARKVEQMRRERAKKLEQEKNIKQDTIPEHESKKDNLEHQMPDDKNIKGRALPGDPKVSDVQTQSKEQTEQIISDELSDDFVQKPETNETKSNEKPQTARTVDRTTLTDET